MADSYHASVHTMLEESREAGEEHRRSTAWTPWARAASSASRASAARCARRAPAASPRRRRAASAASTPTAWRCATSSCRTRWAPPPTRTTPTEVMKTLAQATPGGTYEIKDWSKLETLAGVVGEAVEPRDTLPKRVADAILAEFNRDHQSPSPFVEKMAPAKRVAKWKELGIMPGGVLPREHVRHLQLPHQRRRQLREPRPQGPAPRHRHRLRRADPARARPGRAVGHADAARRSRSTSASSTPSTSTSSSTATSRWSAPP